MISKSIFFAAVTTLASVLLFADIREARAAVNIVNCPSFTATPYALPNGTHGNNYALSMGNASLSCAQATNYAKKLITEHAPVGHIGQFMLSGGPAGYECAAQGDSTGLAYRGGCNKPSADFSGPSFGWRPE